MVASTGGERETVWMIRMMPMFSADYLYHERYTDEDQARLVAAQFRDMGVDCDVEELRAARRTHDKGET